MLVLSLLILIIAIAIQYNQFFQSLFFLRIGLLIFALTGAISLNALYIQSIGSGMGIYSGLFQVTAVTQSFDLFIFLMGAFILLVWPVNLQYYMKTNSKISSLSNSTFDYYSQILYKGRDLETVGYMSKIMNVISIKNYPREYSLITLLSTLGASLLISTSDLISLYLSIELQSFGVYILASIYRNSGSAVSAGLKYFLLGSLSSCIILLGCSIIYTYTGLTHFDSLYSFITVTDNTGIIQGISLGIVLIFIGFFFKIGAAPLHNWSPAKRSGKTLFSLEKWEKLSNSGDTLKPLIPSHPWKMMSGWSNDSCMVTSQRMSENEMGNRGSKSVTIAIVKEQRVDGSWCINTNYMHLKYTLKGLERDYRVKIPSKQLNNKLFSTLSSLPSSLEEMTEVVSGLMEKNQSNITLPPLHSFGLLNPWFITGFTDAEGCFQVLIRQDFRQKVQWRVSLAFQIQLHVKDIAILKAIQQTLGVGTITTAKSNMANYNVWSVKELQIIIDHFNQYSLITVKHSDFLIFKQCFEIIKNREHLTEKGLFKIVELKSSLNLGISDKLNKFFPNVIAVKRPSYIFKGIPDPFWVAGFTSGDGSFYLHVSERVSKVNTRLQRKVVLNFAICLHIREVELIKGLIAYFKSNSLLTNEKDVQISSSTLINRNNLVEEPKVKSPKHLYQTDKTVTLYFRNFSDIINIIIPFFEKYPILGIKSLDFADFKKVADIVKTQNHLNQEGFNKVVKINSTMNQRRPWSSPQAKALDTGEGDR